MADRGTVGLQNPQSGQAFPWRTTEPPHQVDAVKEAKKLRGKKQVNVVKTKAPKRRQKPA